MADGVVSEVCAGGLRDQRNRSKGRMVFRGSVRISR